MRGSDAEGGHHRGTPGIDDSPLTPEQGQALEDARERASSFAGAAKVAAFNGWTLAVFAALSIALGVFSLAGFLVGVGLAVVARNEFVGRRRILAHDPAGFALLWKNQLGLMALVVAYCAWAMYRARVAPDPALQELDALLGEGASELFGQLVSLAYGAVIVGTVVYQGLHARYYFVRIARLEAYLAETPAWIQELMRVSGKG